MLTPLPEHADPCKRSIVFNSHLLSVFDLTLQLHVQCTIINNAHRFKQTFFSITVRTWSFIILIATRRILATIKHINHVFGGGFKDKGS